MLNWFRKKKKTNEEAGQPLIVAVEPSPPEDLSHDQEPVAQISSEPPGEGELSGSTAKLEPVAKIVSAAEIEPVAGVVAAAELEPVAKIVSAAEIEPVAGVVAVAELEFAAQPPPNSELSSEPASPLAEVQPQGNPGQARGEEEVTQDDTEIPVLEAEKQRPGIFARFKNKLSATRDRLAGRLENLLSSVRAIDDDLLDELEELLITSDLGIKTTEDLLYKIRGQVAKKELKDSKALKEALRKAIENMMELPQPVLPTATPLVIMVVGINGVGKTTTIAKLARRYIGNGQKVLLAAGDTFRSAAVEQLGIWAERLGADIVSQPTGADASAVVFDALTAARARNIEVVIVDTAGRLHTKVNLMDELIKIKRVAGKAMPGAPHHTILILDGNTGQNAHRQAQTFHEAVGIDSIIMTKLDGTSKGGVIVSITNELKIPITDVGLGESFEDLEPFDSKAFTEAILGE